MTIPGAFELEVPQKGRTYRARLTWRDERSIGVEFLDAAARVRGIEHRIVKNLMLVWWYRSDLLRYSVYVLFFSLMQS